MGKLLSILRTPCNKDVDVFVDFENAQPSPAEAETYRTVEEVIKESKTVLKDMQSYKGAMAEIREAINNPHSDEAQMKAWTATLEHVGNLKSYYDFSKKLETVVSLLLADLCSNDMSSMEHLEQQQALVRQFAELLDFTLAFDEAKMVTPSVQNDFSYYRRRANHMKLSQEGTNGEAATGDIALSSEVQGRMSLFFAESRPMMKCVSETTRKFVSEHKEIPVEITTETLAKMAAVCRVMISTPEYRERFANSETVMFVIRVMVGVLILYDHVHPNGAFAKNPNIDMEKFIRVLKTHAANTNLLDALRYTSLHFNDSTTPDSIKKSLAHI